MGLVIGIILGLVAIFLSFLVVFADGMSDVPGKPNDNSWPLIVILMLLSAVCIASHYVKW